MKACSDKFKQYIKTGTGGQFIFKCEIKTTANDIYEIGGEYFQKINIKSNCMDDTLCIGYTSSNMFDCIIDMTKYKNVILKKAQLTPYYGVKYTDGTTEYIKMGVYNIDEIEEQTDFVYKITAYDNMMKFDTRWAGTTFPVSVKNLLATICDRVGVDVTTTAQINEEYIILDGAPFIGCSHRVLLGLISELYGAFAYINQDGVLDFKFFDTTQSCYDIEENIFDYKVNKNIIQIDMIQLNCGENEYKSGNGATALYMTENNAILRKTQDNKTIMQGIIDNIYNQRIQGGKIAYYQGSVTIEGNPILEIGDTIDIKINETEKRTIISSIEMKDMLTVYISSPSYEKKQNMSYNRNLQQTYEGTSTDTIKFGLAQNMDTFTLETNEEQVITSIKVTADAKTSIFCSLTVNFTSEVGSTSNLKYIYIYINGELNKTFFTDDTGLVTFAISYVPIIKTGELEFVVKIKNNGGQLILPAESCMLSIIVKNGEVAEAPKFPVVYITQIVEKQDIKETHSEIQTIAMLDEVIFEKTTEANSEIQQTAPQIQVVYNLNTIDII